MNEFWLIAAAILAVDIANPVLLAAVIFCLSTERPYVSSLSLIAGHTVSYTVFGGLIIFGFTEVFAKLLAPLADWFNNPAPSDYIVTLVLGLVMLVIAFRWRISPPEPAKKTPETQSGGVLGYLLFGGVINFVGAPFAVPYFSFLNQLMRLEEPLILPNLLVYNVLYAVPFLLVPLALAVFGKRVLPVLQAINAGVDKYSAYIMPVLIAALGLFLLVDAVLFFSRGTGLV